MPAAWDRALATFGRLRVRSTGVDHGVRTIEHYVRVNGNAQAGAVTFFGFLSFFPILALGFFVIGLLSGVAPDLREGLQREIESLLPGVVGPDEGEIPLRTFEEYAGRVGLLGLVGVLYSGLGWLSGMRRALEVMFVMPAREQSSFAVGKLRDLAALTLIGVTLVVSVALSAIVSGSSERLIGWLGFDADAGAPRLLLWLIAHGLAVAVSTALLLMMFALLARPHLPRATLVWGAVLGAVGFELLKIAAGFLIGFTKGQAAFQAFGVALILVVWINYFSRLVMVAAAWSYTSPAAAEQRRLDSMRAPGAALAGVGDREIEERLSDGPQPAT